MASNLQRDVSALVSILSFITRRAEGLGQGDDEHRNLHPSSPEETDTMNESVDEIDFEGRIDSDDEKLSTIKRNTLDRLAEVLAKFKTAKGTATSDNRNRDAKHVTGLMMVEDLSGKTAKFFCAKNEGLDKEDLQFLRKLESLYQSIIINEFEKTEVIEQAFELMVSHQAPRVKHYSTVLAKILKDASQASPPTVTLTSENLQRGPRQCATRSWMDDNGLKFEIPIVSAGEDSLSDNAANCLSDREGENLVSTVFHDTLRCFGDAHPVTQTGMKNLLGNIYNIVRHPRRRPVLKGLLRPVIHDRKSFKTAWSSLLYLTRIFHAAVTFEQFASKSGFASITFQQVSPLTPHVAKQAVGKTPKQILDLLDLKSLPNWGHFFSHRDKVKDFIKVSRKQKPIHAEVQLVTHFLQRAQTVGDLGDKVFPYIGCSKKLCFFCAVFCGLAPLGDEPLHSRGSHLALFSLWALPSSIPNPGIELIDRFSKLLRLLLRNLLSAATPPFQLDLIQQSSAALSTAKAVQRERLEYTTRPLVSRRMMLGFGGVLATDRQMEFLPLHDKPGYASVLGGMSKYSAKDEIPIYEAEITEINHSRKQDGLEEIQEMPLAQVTDQRLCRRCGGPADYRCRTCWSFYCSSACKKRDAAAHVFTCRMPNRPNDVDFLRLAIRRVSREIKSEDDERLHNALIYLLSDDHICRTFGFNNCADRFQVLGLICLYATLFAQLRPAVRALQEQLEAGTLVQFMLTFCKLERDVARLRNSKECSCVSWFLGWSPDTFPIPNLDQDQYDIWIAAANSAFTSLNVDRLFEAGTQLSRSQRDVLDLYIAIQPTVWRLPDATTSTWIKFGFCHCRTFAQRVQLAKHYLSLASSGATFDDIVSAYEALGISELMRARGVDTSELESQGVVPRRPSACEYSVFRLMISVEHALSGRFCDCFRVHEQRECHRPFETHLERECDTNFGFHLTSSWEKWQLLNFYRYIFWKQGFDPRRMAQAVESSDRDSLEVYLESLDSQMRKRLHLGHRGNLLFPRLKDRMEMRSLDGSVVHSHLPCECKLHDVVGPHGTSFWSVEAMLASLGFGDQGTLADGPAQIAL